MAALVLVSAEWLALGWLSGVNWPATSAAAFWAPRWGLHLLVGAGLCAGAQLLLALVGVGFGSIPLTLGVAAVGAAGLRLVSRSRAPAASADDRSRRENLGWLLLGTLVLAALVRALLVPEAGWDAYSHWGLRAQAFAMAGTIVDARSEHEYYPPLVPLLEAWLYLHRGLPSIDAGKTVWAVVGGALGVCLAWQLRLSLATPWLAPYLAVGILASTPALLEGFWTSQADLALTAFLTLATLASAQWQRSARHRLWLVQAGVFAAAAALTKFEGLPRVAVVVVAVLVGAACGRRRADLLPAVVLAAAAGLGLAVWTLFQLTHGIAANAEHLAAPQPLALGSVLLSLVAVFGGVRTGGGLVVAALAWLLAARRLPGLLVLVVLGQLVATLLAFMLSSAAPDVEVRTSATRLFEQFVPLALFAGAVGLSARTRRPEDTYNRPAR